MLSNAEAVAAAKRILAASRSLSSPLASDRGSIAAAKRALAPGHTDPADWSCDTSSKTIEVSAVDKGARGGRREGEEGNACPRSINGAPRHSGPLTQEDAAGLGNGSSVNVGGGSLYLDNTRRIPFSPGLFNEYGDDLPRAPTVLTGVMADWPAMQPGPNRWSVASLASRGTGPHDAHFSVDGGPGFARCSLADARVSMGDMMDYCSSDSHSDLAPLYVFDPAIGTRTFADGTRYADEFAVPECFSQDTMQPLAGSVSRPLPPGWLLLGGKRSGTPIHNHPHTVAWNALLEGTKLWVCLPPDCDPMHLLLLGDDCTEPGGSGEEGGEDGAGGESETGSRAGGGASTACDGVGPEGACAFDLEAMAWFQHWNCDGGEALPEEASVIVQQAGEVVFVPAGWWHVVLNCSAATVALSHSLGLRRDFERTWPAAAAEDPSFAAAWRLGKERLERQQGAAPAEPAGAKAECWS